LTGHRRTIGNWLGSALLLAPALVVCIRYLDVPAAFFVKDHLFGNRNWSEFTSDLPDLLLMLVLLVTCVALTLYLVRKRKGIYDRETSLERALAWATPCSYLAKLVLKFAFGRVNTRYWLSHPDLYGFHWFQGLEHCDGFPSGHMLVIVTVLAAFARFYPRSRPLCLLAASLLACALIATNYHFLSDVIAGAWAGMLVEAAVCRMLFHESLRLERGLSG